MPNAPKTFCLILIIATAGFVAGCSGGEKIDSGDAEDVIVKQYPSQADGLELTEIDCGDADAKADETFECTARNDAGVSLEIESTITGVDGDKVNFDWTITKATSDGSAYADVAVSTLQNEGYAVDSITCPEFEIKKGVEVECDATMGDGSEQTATITLTDDNGGFDVVTSGPRS
ncbi:MAG: DUF4333 domain-containing protein [Actinomycetota bacterium]|nr:DUF4333 domain-containing protein [Actinomycetota bacterium]